MKNSGRIAIVVLTAALALPMAARAQDSSGVGNNPQVPQPDQTSGVNWKGVGVGAGTVVGNILYMPAKLLYGIGGGIVGGAGYLLTGGNTQVSNTIWRSSLGGDYVLTPAMVAGKEPVHFSGPTAMTQLPPASDGTTVANSYPAPSAQPMNGSAHPIDNGAGPLGNAPSHMSNSNIE
jgi:hypothetical protein